MADQRAMEYLCVYDPQFKNYGETFLAEYGSNAAAEPIGNTTDLISVLQTYAMVRYFEICLHGSPGMLWFSSGGTMVASYLGTVTNSANVLCRDARVLFLGCNVAEGTDGDKFLTDVGKTMFKGVGGTVGGSTVMNVLVFGRQPKMFPFGKHTPRLKVRRFDTNGDPIGSRDVDQFGYEPLVLNGGCW